MFSLLSGLYSPTQDAKEEEQGLAVIKEEEPTQQEKREGGGKRMIVVIFSLSVVCLLFQAKTPLMSVALPDTLDWSSYSYLPSLNQTLNDDNKNETLSLGIVNVVDEMTTISGVVKETWNSSTIKNNNTTTSAATVSSNTAKTFEWNNSIGWHQWCEHVNKPFVSNHSNAYLWADKHQVKARVAALRPNLRIAKEYASVEFSDNITDEFLTTQVPHSTFLMKTTHLSGGIAMVTRQKDGKDDDEFKCLKPRCFFDSSKVTEKTIASHNTMAQTLQQMCHGNLQRDYGAEKGELWYLKIHRRCFFEEALPEVGSRDFRDYKIWTMNGQVMIVQIDQSRHVGIHRQSHLTPLWKRIPIHQPQPYYHPPITNQGLGNPPPYWDEMLQDARILAQEVNMPYSRIDFFGFGHTGYAFAEITFAHDSCKRGRFGFLPAEIERWYGHVQTHADVKFDPEQILQDIEGVIVGNVS